MDVVNRLPRPKDPEALDKLSAAQGLLCAKIVSEEDCHQAIHLLEELAEPPPGGFDYFPAYLTLASLYSAGFEPAVSQDKLKACGFYLLALTHDRAAVEIDGDLLQETAAQLCALVREDGVGAQLVAEDRRRLEALALQGVGAGSVASVAAWVRLAHAEATRLAAEAAEDPEARERRLKRERAREAARLEVLGRQKQSAQEALAKSSELREEGNDLYRQGSLPGNASGKQLLLEAAQLYTRAIAPLSECLPQLTVAQEEAAELRRQRATLLSNATQAQIMLGDWHTARELVEASLVDDPHSFKARYRLAKAHLELREPEAAAKTADESLRRLASQKGAEADAARLELWHLAEEISSLLPEFKWSSAKPVETKEVDYERRLLGCWDYPGGRYEIKIMGWGSLVFLEDEVKVDLLRKSKLRWSGEFEKIPGMVLNMSYEPGADVVVTEFVPPPDMPQHDQYKGPMRFTAKRSSVTVDPPQEFETKPEPEDPPLREWVDVAPVVPPSPKVVEAPVEAPPSELWLCYREGAGSSSSKTCTKAASVLLGRYKLLETSDDDDRRPRYQRVAVEKGANGCSTGVGDIKDSAAPLFLWHRGGNWGVTAKIHTSALVAPFLARCADNIGRRARHPLDLNRPQWQVQTGRGKEELDAALFVGDSPPSAPSVSPSAFACSSSRTGDTDPRVRDSGATIASPSISPSCLSGAPPPDAVEVYGRSGTHAEVNGRYDLQGSYNGRPLYRRSSPGASSGYEEQQWALDPEQVVSLALYFEHGHWILAREVCALPRAIARCRSEAMSPDEASSGSGAGSNPSWEFLYEEDFAGRIVHMDTRKYQPDRSVRVRPADGSTGMLGLSSFDSKEASTTEAEHRLRPPSSMSSTSLDRKDKDDPPVATTSWVSSTSTELQGSEVKVAIVVRQGVSLSLSDLELNVALECLEVILSGEKLSLPLPIVVDSNAGPVARWSEKTRTLRVRLSGIV